MSLVCTNRHSFFDDFSDNLATTGQFHVLMCLWEELLQSHRETMFTQDCDTASSRKCAKVNNCCWVVDRALVLSSWMMGQGVKKIRLERDPRFCGESSDIFVAVSPGVRGC
ncbi:unnamed protein product [Protopolystoma xenopodis]|uniref:Uncharacterized protein n=1 Tax=Protopolystoma xenopodis TaxID=117903 RepID=A0A3S5CHS7_9PLAT|nr:unnamed protein product [Protopolystoma xenopodis]